MFGKFAVKIMIVSYAMQDGDMKDEETRKQENDIVWSHVQYNEKEEGADQKRHTNAHLVT